MCLCMYTGMWLWFVLAFMWVWVGKVELSVPEECVRLHVSM